MTKHLSEESSIASPTLDIPVSKNSLQADQKKEKKEQQAADPDNTGSFKNKLVSVIAHDLKNPLGGLISAIQLVEDEAMPVAELRNLIPGIKANAAQVLFFLESILKWSYLEVGYQFRPETIHVKSFLQKHIDLYKLLTTRKRIETSVECDEQLLLHADKNALSLIMRNLLDNATKFTPFNGKIKIGVKESPGSCTLFVSNSGNGIRKEIIDQILSSQYKSPTFDTDNNRSSGIGLLLCKDFIEHMNSSLKIESRENGITTFSFGLPC